jgi:acyl dehydratase
MPIDPANLIARKFEPREHRYDETDTILYALGCGLGIDPLDEGQLAFVYENQLRVLPSIAVILAHPGFWAHEHDTGIDWRRVLHLEQSFSLSRPIKARGHVIGRNRVTAIYDKGADRGSLLHQEREISDLKSGDIIATTSSVSFLRGDGGKGGTPGAQPKAHVIPNRPPDAICVLPIPIRSSLIFRLSGDRNPLHVDPQIAEIAGFPRPILHGLATMGMCCHSVLRSILKYRVEMLRGMSVRFSAPVFPGETLSTELWRDGAIISFRSTVVERGAKVIDAGRADLW